MIGLVDYDFLTSSSKTSIIPNLEIMKLAAYYRKEENEFCRLLTLEENQDLNTYNKIYFFSEQNVQPKIPPIFLKAENVLFGGTSFTNNYVPFKNSIIDYTLPSVQIYKELLKQKYNDGIKTSVIEHVLDNSYYRMYAGDNKLPIPPIRKNKQVYIFDKQFFIGEWEKIITDITERHPSTIKCIHPIICKTLSDYLKVRNYPSVSRANIIILDLNVPSDEITIMLNKYKNQFLADITYHSNVCLPIGGDYKSKTLYYKDFIYKINLLYSFWSKGIPINIFVRQCSPGFVNPIINLEIALSYINFQNKKHFDYTLQDKIPKKKKNNILADEYNELIKFYPDAKDLFTQSFNQLKLKGVWRL